MFAAEKADPLFIASHSALIKCANSQTPSSNVLLTTCLSFPWKRKPATRVASYRQTYSRRKRQGKLKYKTCDFVDVVKFIVYFYYQLDARILYFNTFITFLYMFRALLCSSSGGKIVLIQHLVSSLCLGDDTRWCTNTICSPEDEYNSARNM